MNQPKVADLLKKIEAQRNELKVELGTNRYEAVTKEIREVLERNGLNEFNSYHLISHLSDIFRVERIRV